MEYVKERSYVVENLAEAALAHHVCATESDYPQKKRKRTTCATDDVIAKAEVIMTNFKPSEYMSAVRYSDVSWDKALRCSLVYEEIRLKDSFIEGLHQLVRFSMRTCGWYITMRHLRV